MFFNQRNGPTNPILGADQVPNFFPSGVPTVVLAVPARHIQSHSSIIHRDDYDNAVKLLVELLKRIDAEKVKAFQEF